MKRIVLHPKALLLIYLAFFFLSTESPAFLYARPLPNPSISLLPADTSKYHGYRLELINFETLKKSEDWVKIRFTAINSGRSDIDFGKTNTAHWIQINFDHSLFDQKLGSLRENIRLQLMQERFTLGVGKIAEKVELKIPTLLAPPPQPGSSSFTETPAAQETADLTAKGLGNMASPPQEPLPKTGAECPDLLFSELTTVRQDSKWATVAYTITNQGKGSFDMGLSPNGKESNLMVRTYISGVTVLSRGALPIDGLFINAQPGSPVELKPGESISGELRIDVRKKTRYMKCLILSLDSNQFASECDKTNNTGAVILD